MVTASAASLTKNGPYNESLAPRERSMLLSFVKGVHLSDLE